MKGFCNLSLCKFMYWFFQSKNLKRKYGDVSLDYMGSINNTHIENHNYIGRNSIVSNCSIGRFSYISHTCYIYNTNIGRFTSIGPNVKIVLGKHPTESFVSTNPVFYSEINPPIQKRFVKTTIFKETEPCKIGNDVFIGANSVILDGVTIGDGAVIAAGAVVNKDVLPYEVVGGVPAKHIKFRFKQEYIDFLTKFRWWEKDENWLEENILFMHDIDSLYNKYNSII